LEAPPFPPPEGLFEEEQRENRQVLGADTRKFFHNEDM